MCVIGGWYHLEQFPIVSASLQGILCFVLLISPTRNKVPASAQPFPHKPTGQTESPASQIVQSHVILYLLSTMANAQKQRERGEKLPIRYVREVYIKAKILLKQSLNVFFFSLP